jgi:hypothetical protein
MALAAVLFGIENWHGSNRYWSGFGMELESREGIQIPEIPLCPQFLFLLVK